MIACRNWCRQRRSGGLWPPTGVGHFSELLVNTLRPQACRGTLPTSRPLDTGVWDNRRERRSPLLGKGGDAAPSSKWSRSFGGAARSV